MRHAIPLALCASAALADPPEVTSIEASRTGDSWRFSVTLAHPDTGWDHYADGWRVELADGTVLGTRVLAHPHVTEQPFTRSQGGIAVPGGVTEVVIRAKCSVDGWSQETTPFALTSG